jgi:hypothetical protein
MNGSGETNLYGEDECKAFVGKLSGQSSGW